MKTKNEYFFRYGQLATAYTFTKAMREAGVPGETIIDVNWIAHCLFRDSIDRYKGIMDDVPDSTYKELAELEYEDLTTAFQEESDRINVDVFGATANELDEDS